MSKRYLFPFLLVAGVILAIAASAIFHILPQNAVSYSDVPLHQAADPSGISVLPALPSTETSLDHSSPPPAIPLSPSATKSVHVSDSQALAHFDQGLKLYYQRQFPEALKLFNQALSIDPLCYEALNAKGATLAFQGHYDQGLALIQQALDLNPAFVYGHFNQGLANELAGRWDLAIAAYQKALQLDNRDTWSYYGIASIYGRQGNIDKVLEYLRPAIILDPDVKEVARNEKDFDPVQKNPRFQALVKP
ncbi:MAG TPA: tetratricopeptide repeat protein [Desulfosporosinus sp.]